MSNNLNAKKLNFWRTTKNLT